jgi:hypothetical protein
MSAVADLPQIECPDALRGLQAWVCWKFERHLGEPKPRKVPFYAGGARRYGVQGSDDDRAQLVTFDAARAAAVRRGMDGVGFCPLPGLGIVALDFDNCRAADGALHPDVERVVAGTYAEWSPSGNGVRAFLRGEGLGNRKAHGEPYGFEVFSDRGFVTLTGRVLPITELTDAGNTLAPISHELHAMCARRFGRAEAGDAGTASAEPLGLTHQQLRDALDVLDASMGHDPWLRVGMALHHETRGEGFELWDEWSARGAQYPGRDALLARWDSFGRGGQRPTTAHALVRMANEAGAHLEVAQLEADDFDVVTEVAEAANKPLKFPPQTVSGMLQQKPPAWLIKDVVPKAELMVLFGESGSGKSFVVLDMAGAIARGTPWLAQRTQRGRVLYVVAEGRGGFGNRIRAYCGSHGVDPRELDGWLTVIADAPNLMQRDDAAEVVRTAAAAGGADVIVLDTFAQVTPGANENAAEDVGKALANCKAIHRATGALVVLVHHTGKDHSRGARGWSGLKAAADAEIEVARSVAGRTIRVSKQKDGKDGRVWGFELDQVVLGRDEDGDALSSCIVREVAPPTRQQAARLGKWQRAVMGAAAELGGTGAGAREAEVMAAAIESEQPADGKRDRRMEYVREAVAELLNRNLLEIADGQLRIL